MSPIDLTVIIVSYNPGKHLFECVKSLEVFLAGISWQAYIVDNASENQDFDDVEAFTNVTVIRNPENVGFAAAVNRGLQSASGRYVMWLNPDAALLDDKLPLLLRYMDEHPDVGVVGPKILNPDGSIQLSCRAFPSYENYFFGRYSILTRLFPDSPMARRYLQHDWAHDTLREVDWVSGACLIHPASLTREIGGLDDGFFMYFEDVDFCRRAKQAGRRVMFHPGAVITHQIAASTRKTSHRMVFEHHRSIWRYYTKYFRRNPFKDAVIFGGLTARCLFQCVFQPAKFRI